MEKNNSVYFNQAAIENAFKSSKERGNYFIEFNRSVILEALKDNKFLGTLNQIYSDIVDRKDLDVDQYTLIGAIAYFYGMDFTGQGYLHLNICEYVAERFAKLFDGYEFSNLEISRIYDIFTSIRECHIVEAKDIMKNSILEQIVLKGEDVNTFKAIIIPGLKSIVNNAIIPINLAKEVSDLKSQKELTYQNISKYNILINQNCDMLGKTIKGYCNIYSQKLYADILNECLIREEKSKFSLMYLDSIISLSEAIERMEISPKEFVQITIDIQGLEDEVNFSEKKSKYLEKFEAAKSADGEQSETTKEEDTKSNYVPKISENDLNAMFASKPDLIVAAYLEEIAKCNWLTVDKILEICDKLTSPDAGDLLQHIYQYMTTNIGRPVDPTDYYPELNHIALHDAFDSKIKEYQDAYREIVEFICQPIPEEQINRVTTYVNDIIGCLILTDTQQKQYLISQFMENNISTYNQLQQIVSLIENAKIFGADASAYSVLYNYLNENDNFTEVFEKAKNLTDLENKISLVTKFKSWFSRYTNPKAIEEESKDHVKPKMEILK